VRVIPIKSGGVGYFSFQLGKHSAAVHLSASASNRYPNPFHTSVLTSKSVHSLVTMRMIFSFVNSSLVQPPSRLTTKSPWPIGPRTAYMGSAASGKASKMMGLTSAAFRFGVLLSLFSFSVSSSEEAESGWREEKDDGLCCGWFIAVAAAEIGRNVCGRKAAVLVTAMAKKRTPHNKNVAPAGGESIMMVVLFFLYRSIDSIDSTVCQAGLDLTLQVAS